MNKINNLNLENKEGNKTTSTNTSISLRHKMKSKIK